VIIWGAAAIVLSFVLTTQNVNAPIYYASGWVQFFAIISGTATGTIGALLGNALRNFAKPDRVFTNGGFFQIIGTKVFWAIGPQCIGLLIGAAMGAGAGALLIS